MPLPERIYVSGELVLELPDRVLRFTDCRVSSPGITGLIIAASESAPVGTRVSAKISVPNSTEPQFEMRVEGYLTREIGGGRMTWGLKLDLSLADRQRYDGHLDRLSALHKTYGRQLPRIPAQARVPSFPLHARLMTSEESGMPMTLICDVMDLSPTGFQLSTQNPLAAALRVSDEVRFILDPRGPFQYPVEGGAIIRRLVEDHDFESGNCVRLIGVQLTALDDVNLAGLKELLKDILARVRGKASAA